MLARIALALLVARGALEATTAAQAPQGEELAARLRAAGPATRDRLYEDLKALGRGERARLLDALELRWRSALSDLLHSNTVTKVDDLAKMRKQLEERQTETIRVFLEDERVSGRPTSTVVSDQLQHLRAVWESDEEVPFRGKPRAAIEEIQWNRARQEELEVTFECPDTLPTWAFVMPLDAKTLSVRTIALDADDRDRLDRTRHAHRLNAERFLTCSSGPKYPTAAEKRVFESVNELREMLGLVPFVWNWKLRDSMPRSWGEYQDEELLVRVARIGARDVGYRGEILGALCAGLETERLSANRWWMIDRNASEAALANQAGRWLWLGGTGNPFASE